MARLVFFLLASGLAVSFAAEPLTLDYATFFGGTLADSASLVRRDGQGNIIVAGTTQSINFPVSNAANSRYGGGAADIFVAKFSPGYQLIWASYYGASAQETPLDLEVDSSGNIYLTGSIGFPVASDPAPFNESSYLLALDPNGRLRFHLLPSQLGPRNRVSIETVALSSRGTIFVAGRAFSPLTVGSLRIQTTFGGGSQDIYLAEISQTGAIVAATYVGGALDDNIEGLTFDTRGNLVLLAVSRATSLLGVTLPPRTEDGVHYLAIFSWEESRASVVTIAVPFQALFSEFKADSTGFWLAGTAQDQTLVTTPNAWQPQKSQSSIDLLLVRVNLSGQVTYATYLGGPGVNFAGIDLLTSLAVDSTGRAYLSGRIGSPPFRLTPDAFRTVEGNDVPFLFIIDPDGTVLHSTYLITDSFVVDVLALGGNQFLGVGSGTVRAPVTAGALQSTPAGQADLWLGQFFLGNPNTPRFGSHAVANGASFAGGAVAPGEVVTFFPFGGGPQDLATASLTGAGLLSTLVGETRVLFDGVAAPMIYSVRGQMSAIVPYAVAGRQNTAAVVEYRGLRSAPVTLGVTAAAPGIFALSGGTGQVAALMASGCCNAAQTPVERGGVLVIYVTGEGQTSPAGRDGVISNYATLEEYPRPVLPVTVKVGGMDAQVLYAGAAPGIVSGVLQINIIVPPGATVGSAVPIEVFVGTVKSPAGTTIAIR